MQPPQRVARERSRTPPIQEVEVKESDHECFVRELDQMPGGQWGHPELDMIYGGQWGHEGAVGASCGQWGIEDPQDDLNDDSDIHRRCTCVIELLTNGW